MAYRRAPLAAIAAIAMASLVYPRLVAAGPLPADLIGYGRIAMTLQRDADGGGAAVFTCEDPAHADRLLSKLRADFTWDGLLGLRKIELPGGVPALALEGSGVVALAENGVTVYVLSAPSPAGATALLDRLGLAGPETRFTPRRAHPAALDYFDLRPLGMNYHPLALVGQDVKGGPRNSFLREELDKAHAFWAPYGIGVVIRANTSFGLNALADGPMSTFPVQYTIGLARAHGQPLVVRLGDDCAPWWMRNKFPRQISQFDPNVLPVWGTLGVTAGTWLSYNSSHEAYAYVQQYTQRLLDRVKEAAGDDLCCIHPMGGGRPGDELGLHEYSTEFMDYDPTGQAAFRCWLREDRKLDLAALGRRWYGDEHYFRNWDEVAIPSHAEFFGHFGAQTYNMLQGWLWRPDRKSAQQEGWGDRAYRPGAEWVPVDLAPSARQFFLDNVQADDATQRIGKTAWFRKEFDPSKWLARQPGQALYLVAVTLSQHNEPVEVWLNGACLGQIVPPKPLRSGPVAMEITGRVGPGRNVLCLKVRAGIIHGPVFLTREKPQPYPYLGRRQNARWVDLRDWLVEREMRNWKREALPIRRQLPDVNLMEAPNLVLCDRFLEFKRDVGLSCVHDTGSIAATYSGNFAGLGYTDGLYMTNEEGGTMADEAAQSQQLAWLLFEGLGHHNWVFNAQAYQKFEQATGWFAKNRRLLSLVGKTVRSRPEIAVLATGKSELYFPYTSAIPRWDIGRGPLQAAQHNNAYVTESEVQNGLAGQYPVLFDDNSTVMSDELLAAIERYVRDGGTFVAMHSSGRHALLEPDTWPITRLTGFRVLGEHPQGIVTIEKHNPLLTKLAGLKFNGSGLSLKWIGFDAATQHPSVAMPATEDAGIPIARWEDGSIAVGLRRLGKGRVVVLGSSFWFSKSDLAGNGSGHGGSLMTAFLNDLLAGLGVAKNVDCSSEDVWARRMETKNGLQDWMVLWNSSHDRVDNVEISFPWARRPARVLDVVSGNNVDFSYADGIARVARFGMASHAARVLGVDRTDFLAAAAHWLAQKQRFESRPELKEPLEPLTPPAVEMPVIDRFRFRMADARAKTDLAWTTEPTTGSEARVPRGGAWKDASYGFWDEMGFEPTGIGLYRGLLEVPVAWKGQRVLLALAAWNLTVFSGTPTVYVNGKLVGPGSSGGDVPNTVLDVTALVHPGANDLGILVEAGPPRGGFLGTVLTYAQRELHPARVLQRGWKLYQDDKKFTAVALPVQCKGRHLQIDTALPSAWKADEIYLDLSLGLSRTVRYVVINDRPLGLNSSGHALPNELRLNLYPWVKPGSVNRIELWSLPNSHTANFDIRSVTLGVLPRAAGQPKENALP